ncbi:MAG TPA: hypothetical protein VGH65_01710, partial [Verrucomicrobiaceae bacterium]
MIDQHTTDQPAMRLALCLLLAPLLAFAAEEPRTASRVYKTVEGRDLKIFIFNPPDWKPTDQRPAMVFFHGGGWVGGGPN